MSLLTKAKLASWSAYRLMQHGRPQVAYRFLGGIGDEFFATSVAHEYLERGIKRQWAMTRTPELFQDILPKSALLPEDPRYFALADQLRIPFHRLSYSQDPDPDKDTPLQRPILAQVCKNAGLSGVVTLKPRLVLNSQERARFEEFKGAIIVQSSSMSARVPMRNKQWEQARMQAVVSEASRKYQVIQVGSASDPELKGASDFRAKTSLRETAALLSQSVLFVGLVGFLMHLARAVDCRAVIIAGGREDIRLTGYPGNLNLTLPMECSPCWQRSKCDHDRKCMQAISTDMVNQAITQALEQRPPLTTQKYDLDSDTYV